MIEKITITGSAIVIIAKSIQEVFRQLLIDVRSPAYTLTPKKWIETVNAIGITSKRGKSGGTMAHPFIACDFEMWNDMSFRYEVIRRFVNF